MECQRIRFSGHAIGRMFERGIRENEVRQVVRLGEVIAEYPDDIPYPSVLLLGVIEGIPLHVVLARDDVSGTYFIVTVYVPDRNIWDKDFRTRRRP